jgi:hypothetical protein
MENIFTLLAIEDRRSTGGMGKETGTQKLHFRVRFEYKVLAQPFGLFRKRRDIKQEAASTKSLVAQLSKKYFENLDDHDCPENEQEWNNSYIKNSINSLGQGNRSGTARGFNPGSGQFLANQQGDQNQCCQKA